MAVVGYIVLGLIAFFLILLLIPVRIVISYVTDQQPAAYIRWLFIKYDLFKEDTQVIKGKPKTEQKSAPGKKKQPAKKSPMEFAELADLVLDGISASHRPIGRLMRRFKIYRLQIYLLVAEGDAAQTAITFGKVNAAVYALYATACSFLNMKKPDIQIRPDFTAEKGSVDFELRGSLRPIRVLYTGARIALAFLVKTIKRRNEREKPETQPDKIPQMK